jgi:hypothetical protein
MIVSAAPLAQEAYLVLVSPPGMSIASVTSSATTAVGSSADPLAAAPSQPTSSWLVAAAYTVASWSPERPQRLVHDEDADAVVHGLAD